jgi:hypothetical protein
MSSASCRETQPWPPTTRERILVMARPEAGAPKPARPPARPPSRPPARPPACFAPALSRSLPLSCAPAARGRRPWLPPLHHPALPRPAPRVPHSYTATAAACLALATFAAASFSDPGRVTPANAAALLAAYPPDGALFEGRRCETCGFARPGRSKHCGACGRWVAARHVARGRCTGRGSMDRGTGIRKWQGCERGATRDTPLIPTPSTPLHRPPRALAAPTLPSRRSLLGPRLTPRHPPSCPSP